MCTTTLSITWTKEADCVSHSLLDLLECEVKPWHQKWEVNGDNISGTTTWNVVTGKRSRVSVNIPGAARIENYKSSACRTNQRLCLAGLLQCTLIWLLWFDRKMGVSQSLIQNFACQIHMDRVPLLVRIFQLQKSSGEAGGSSLRTAPVEVFKPSGKVQLSPKIVLSWLSSLDFR
jgi:hypothetical protein